jgi:pimeloyl-ACP methyl ester carboxylesterase
MPLTTINGFKHYYEDVGAGEALVQLHGAHKGTHITEENGFEPLWPELSKHYRVIAPDMRSMGRSEHVESMPDSAWVDDLLALLDELGIEKAHVHGHSLGSRVAIRFAIEHPDRTHSVILTAPHTYLTPELDAGQNRTGGDATKLTPEQQEEEKHLHGDPGYLEVWRNYHNIRNQVSLQEYYNFSVKQPLMDVVYRCTAAMSDVKAPILVVASDKGNLRHAMEIKLDMPEEVRLAIIPSYGPGPMTVEAFCSTLTAFTDYVRSRDKAPSAAR